ncbi:G-protein coupled receptor 35 [Manis javanica]|nr:G-protein coupled receptor 35 [Manis javanica]
MANLAVSDLCLLCTLPFFLHSLRSTVDTPLCQLSQGIYLANRWLGRAREVASEHRNLWRAKTPLSRRCQGNPQGGNRSRVKGELPSESVDPWTWVTHPLPRQGTDSPRPCPLNSCPQQRPPLSGSCPHRLIPMRGQSHAARSPGSRHLSGRVPGGDWQWGN